MASPHAPFLRPTAPFLPLRHDTILAPLCCRRTQAKAGELGEALPSLTELDLSDNLLHDWGQVAQLLQVRAEWRAQARCTRD